MPIPELMPLRPAGQGRNMLVEIYRSDAAYWAGLLVLWELLIVLVALWVFPLVLTAASDSGALLSNASVLGAGA